MAKSRAGKVRIGWAAGVTAGVLSLGIAGAALATNDSDSGHTSAHKSSSSAASAKSDDTADSAKSDVGSLSAKSSDNALSAKSREAETVKAVSDFYRAYLAATHKGDLVKIMKLQEAHLTDGAAKDVAAWDKKHGTDGILHTKATKNSPKLVDGRVRYNGPPPDGGLGGADSWKQHPWSIAILQGGKKRAYVAVQYDLKSHKISAIG